MAETTLKKNANGYNYKYTDLAEIHSYLESKGWSYYQYIDVIDGNDYIVTVTIKDGKESQPIRGCRVVQATLKGTNNPAQVQGSALTYARRYSVLMAFGLCTSDDDAQIMSTPKTQQSKEELVEQTKTMLEVKGITLEKYEETAGCRIDELSLEGLKAGLEWIKGA